MNRRWSDRFMELADLVASWSKDPSTKVGAVIIGQDNRIISCGYNGPPRGIDDHYAYRDRNTKLACTIHAEENALLFSRRDVSGMHLFVTHMPCAPCAAKIIQSGITKVHTKVNPDFDKRWMSQLLISKEMFESAGVHVDVREEICQPKASPGPTTSNPLLPAVRQTISSVWKILLSQARRT